VQNANYVALALDGPLAPFAVFLHSECVNPLREVCPNEVKIKGVSMAKFSDKEAALVEVRGGALARGRAAREWRGANPTTPSPPHPLPLSLPPPPP